MAEYDDQQYKYDAVLQAMDTMTVRQIRQLIVELNLRLEFLTRKQGKKRG